MAAKAHHGECGPPYLDREIADDEQAARSPNASDTDVDMSRLANISPSSSKRTG
jgi:hypothetical protein